MIRMNEFENLLRSFEEEKDRVIKNMDDAKQKMMTDLIKEIACIRALLERILRVMDEGLFLDYQFEKYDEKRIGYLEKKQRRKPKG